MSMKIISSGALSTFQDLGRTRYLQYGFSACGAMDSRSAAIANLLVGNAGNDCVLEMTMLGITAVFTSDAVIALTGADMSPTIDGEEIPMYTAVKINAGSTLRCMAAKNGSRTYLSVAGGYELDYVMGSFSTNLKCSLGGFGGRKLKNGDEIKLKDKSGCTAIFAGRKSVPEKFSSKVITVRSVLGPQEDYFTKKGIETFLSMPYTVSQDSDRMGIRLNGRAIEAKDKYDIISDGITLGSVQIPPSGEPIVMMSDRQTTGGYAKIATVISVDIPRLAQAVTGTRVFFTQIDIKDAQKLYVQQKKELLDLEKTLSLNEGGR